MIQVKCVLPLVAFVAMYSCQSGNSELKFSVPDKTNLPATFKEYPATVILKEDSIRMTAARYALPSLPRMDSIELAPVYLPMYSTNGKFYMLSVKRGEQYNIMLPGRDRAFVNAGTLFFMNLQAGKKNYVIQGKAWIKAEMDSAIIKTDELTIIVRPGSKINIDNYPNDSNTIISLTEGYARVVKYGDTIHLIPKWEVWVKKATGRIISKMSPVDVTSWTVGTFRRWDIGFRSVMSEIGRLYDKDVYIGEIDGETHALNFDYRNSTLEQVVELYNNTLPSVKLEISGDSLKVFSQIAIIKKKPSS